MNANLLSLIPNRPAELLCAQRLGATVYVNGNPPRTDATLRKFERDVAAARATDPYLSKLPAADHAVHG